MRAIPNSDGAYKFEIYFSIPADPYDIDVYAIETSFENIFELLFYGKVPFVEAQRIMLYEWLLTTYKDPELDIPKVLYHLDYVKNKLVIDKEYVEYTKKKIEEEVEKRSAGLHDNE